MSEAVAPSDPEGRRSAGGRTPPLLVAQGVEKEYRGTAEPLRVLKGVNLTVHEAELVAVVGASGVGKSTLLHVLGALDRPTAGSVWFRGQDLFARSEAELTRFRREEVGFVFQLYNLLADFSALENAMLPALIQRRPAAEARAAGHRGPPRRGAPRADGAPARRAVRRRAAAGGPGPGARGPAAP